MVKNPNWQEADQLTIYKHGQGVELRATEKQLQLVVGAGLQNTGPPDFTSSALITRPPCLQ